MFRAPRKVRDREAAHQGRTSVRVCLGGLFVWAGGEFPIRHISGTTRFSCLACVIQECRLIRPESVCNHYGPSRSIANCRAAAYGLDGNVSQFGDRQILDYAPVLVIEDQVPLAIDFYAADHARLDITLPMKSESHHKRHVGSHTGMRHKEGVSAGKPLDIDNLLTTARRLD